MSSASARPTSLLVMPTRSPEKKFTQLKKQILVADAKNTIPQLIVFCIGGLLLAGCGILMYLRKIGLWPWMKQNE